MAIYMEFKGSKQGTITGDAIAASYKNQIVVFSVEFGMGHPTDANTGLATGKQVHRPLVLTKSIDMASPLLMTACVTNETATTVTFKYVGEGASQKNFVQIMLTNAVIQDFNHIMFDDGSKGEKLILSYQKIEYTWVNGGIMAESDMTAS
jgi:type VI secretion system secreted protein Hcp